MSADDSLMAAMIRANDADVNEALKCRPPTASAMIVAGIAQR